ncbi:Endonuclease/exonuclease/phosphatase [Glomus cerebriforme]|uniref:sphingomyelin phosphodiesterase n=1 Tax=Glomus cerebriforme TaxID=658196 RepID=A0A397TL63_9GLOM|nr:Endonuclease/exonuclease/phosphatase [Glomus cerebriforme]
MSEVHENGERDGAQSKIETRLLTYNIFIRPPLIKNNISDYKDFRLDYFIKNVLHEYGIICLEEMFQFGSCRRARLLEAARKEGFNYSLTSPTTTVFKLAVDGGLVMLSRFPIRESDILIYPSGVHSDRFSNKGALYAKIELAQKNNIHLFMTHTQASYVSAPPLTDTSVLVRQEQISLLRKFIDKCTLNALSEEPIILVGDMNVNSRPQPNSSDVNGDTAEYLNMVKILSGEGIEVSQIEESTSPGKRLYNNSKIVSVKDILKERYEHHPITFGDVIVADDGTVSPRETVLPGKDDLLAQASLDYIFLIGAGQSKQQVIIDIQRTRVEEFFVNDAPVTQLSDHYGVSTYLINP